MILQEPILMPLVYLFITYLLITRTAGSY